MAEQGKVRGRAQAWRPWAGAGGPPLAWPPGLIGFANGAAQRVHGWALADVGPGRLVPWIAIAYGIGIILYFSTEQEPASWAAIALLAGTVAAAVAARNRPVGFPVALALAAIAAGFATATVKRALIAHLVVSAGCLDGEIPGVVTVPCERGAVLRPL